MLDISSKNLQGYFGLARTYAETGQDAKALGMVGAAQKLGLEDKVDVQRIHDIINDKKKKEGMGKSPLEQKKKAS